MAVDCRSLLTVLVGFVAASQLNTALASRHLSAAASALNTSALSVADSSDSALTGFDATQYLHAGCAVFLDNSTIFTAQTADNSVPTMYRGMTATVINYASTNISVPWSFQLTSTAPGYSGIKQAFNFDNSSVTNGVVSGTATADYLTVLPKAANNITIGLLLEQCHHLPSSPILPPQRQQLQCSHPPQQRCPSRQHHQPFPPVCAVTGRDWPHNPQRTDH